jgi:hypothetical protein
MRLTDIAIKRLPAPPRGNKITYDDAVTLLKAKGLPFQYLVFDGEQHGFRRAARHHRLISGLVNGHHPRGSQAAKARNRRWR